MIRMWSKKLALGIPVAAVLMYVGCSSDAPTSGDSLKERITKHIIRIAVTANTGDKTSDDGCGHEEWDNPTEPHYSDEDERRAYISSMLDCINFPLSNPQSNQNATLLYTFQKVMERRLADTADSINIQIQINNWGMANWGFIMNYGLGGFATIGPSQISSAQQLIRAQKPYASPRDTMRLEVLAASLPVYNGLTLDSAMRKFVAGN